MHQSFGWANRGIKVFGEISGKRYARESFVAALCGSEILSPFCFKDTCDTDLFNAWIETCLVPVLKPGQVVILDNSTFHKSEKTKTLIEHVNCTLLFLSSYSPDLNPYFYPQFSGVSIANIFILCLRFSYPRHSVVVPGNLSFFLFKDPPNPSYGLKIS